MFSADELNGSPGFPSGDDDERIFDPVDEKEQEQNEFDEYDASFKESA